MVKEATSLGAALSVAVGVGIYDSLEEAAGQAAKIERTVEPDLENHEIYQKYYGRWQKVHAYCMKMVEDELLKPMWHAPGL